ncbi:unnamed protein product [Ectocarpus sp. CCAP 1310/34]|nr:unnamed protein product [Ectocarpus sp. CCAP 1310/34]
MTGITDALHDARAAVGLNPVESPEETCRPIPRPCSAWQQRQALVPNVEVRKTFEPGDVTAAATSMSPRAAWALLLPITSFGIGGQDNAKCMSMLGRFKGSLLSTTTADDRSAISICVAIDEDDPVYTMTKGEVEAFMRDVSETAGLPLGMASMAFRDLTIPAFSSFPASTAVTWSASLKNLGKEEARYPKVGVRWQAAILTREIGRFSRLVRPTGLCLRSLGVVVPTFRCEVSMLREIVSLESTAYPNVVEEVNALTSYAKHHVVRIFINKENLGASKSRNIGLSQAFSDHVLLLDDDVVPERHILHAYRGGIDRFPIAKVVAYPPWGVTANPCVSGRSGDIWFSPAYPKTGDGEDVDFCLKTSQRYGRDAIVAVPGAAATLSCWANPIRQVWGWARGDARCVSFHRHSTIFCATIVLIWLVFGVANIWSVRKCLTASGVVETLEFLEGLAHVYRGTTGAEPWSAVLLAPMPSMGNLYQLLLPFDWMDGKEGHKWRKASRVLHAAKLATNLLIVVGAALGYGLHRSLAVVAANQRAPARLVVLAWQRTGRNLLCGLLHNHSGVFIHNEIFHNRAIHTFHQDRLEKWGWAVAHRDADTRRFISEVWTRSDRPDQAIGSKLFPEHIYRDPDTMAPLLADHTAKKIVLRRGNAVGAYVSQRRALLTGQFLQVQQPGNVSIRIDPDELQDHLANYKSCYAIYPRLLAGQAFHEVLHADLCGSARGSTFRGIADFLGARCSRPRPLAQTARQAPASVSNREEQARAFRHAVYTGEVGAYPFVCGGMLQ